MRTIIAGSRNVTDKQLLIEAINGYPKPITCVISGGAKGADSLGEWWAKENNIPLEIYPADWKTLGRRAGYHRNEQMLEVSEALIALWDGVSRGTKHMIDISKKRGIFVYVFYTNTFV